MSSEKKHYCMDCCNNKQTNKQTNNKPKRFLIFFRSTAASKFYANIFPARPRRKKCPKWRLYDTQWNTSKACKRCSAAATTTTTSRRRTTTKRTRSSPSPPPTRAATRPPAITARPGWCPPWRSRRPRPRRRPWGRCRPQPLPRTCPLSRRRRRNRLQTPAFPVCRRRHRVLTTNITNFTNTSITIRNTSQRTSCQSIITRFTTWINNNNNNIWRSLEDFLTR